MHSRRLRPVWIRSLIALFVLLAGLALTQWWASQVISRQSEANTEVATREADQFHDNIQAGVQPAYFLTHAMDLYVRNEKGVLKAEPTNR